MELNICENFKLVDPGLVNTRSPQAYLIRTIFRTLPFFFRIRQKGLLGYPRLTSESGLYVLGCDIFGRIKEFRRRVDPSLEYIMEKYS